MHHRAALCALLLLLLAGWALSAAAQTSDVASSWMAARVFLPGRPDPVVPAEIPVGQRLPTLLYMHGCSGADESNDLPWARYLSQLGYIVVIPDRFARADKASSCWPDRNRAAHEMRREELGFAIEQIKSSVWADPTNLFLMGFSEGADAIAESRIDGVQGAILSSWTCRRVNDLALPLGLPILSILWDERSRWRWWDRGESDCPAKFAGRDGFHNLELRGKGHATYGARAAREAVGKFLREHLTQHPSG